MLGNTKFPPTNKKIKNKITSLLSNFFLLKVTLKVYFKGVLNKIIGWAMYGGAFL